MQAPPYTCLQRVTANKKWASSFYRTATTQYPCCVPALGDSRGAGRKRLTHGTKIEKKDEIPTRIVKEFDKPCRAVPQWRL